MELAQFKTTTHGVQIIVTPLYLASESRPEEGQFIWAYHVRIENKREDAVQLLTRHWVITDAAGRTQEVKGDGVIGEQPTILPGVAHEYASGTHLPTSSGIMAGSYGMVDEHGELFDVTIPTFSLDSPESHARAN